MLRWLKQGGREREGGRRMTSFYDKMEGVADG